MTLGFVYLAVFLLGFTLALVGGLARRVLHPTELCSEVVVPSHEHWLSLQGPLADLAVSFLTLFGFATFLLHGFARLPAPREVLVGAGVGLVGALVLRRWLRTAYDPTRRGLGGEFEATVVRTIPEIGYGQVELEVGGSKVRLAARSGCGAEIARGTRVRALDRQESVVVVVPCRG